MDEAPPRRSDRERESPTPATVRAAPAPSPAPVSFPERYQDLGPIARGGWGEVRRVRDVVMDRVVVAKILAWEHVDSATARARFLNEARVTASLDHPGIVPILDGGTLPDGRPWFAMKEVAGRTLNELVAEPIAAGDPATRLRRLVEILVRVSEIVGYAHERAVVHRDLKPGNVMVGRFGEVLVLDWGIARLATDPVPRGRARPKGDTSRTQPGDVLGTTAYMAPEQARGAHAEVGAPADVYAIGLMLFEVLHYRRAREGSQVVQWAQATRGDIPPIDGGPEELRAICAHALRASPGERPANGMELAHALREWLDGAARRKRAELAVAEAARREPELAELRARRDALRAEALRASSDLRDHDPLERKVPIWQLEDRAHELEREIAIAEARRIEALRAALEHEPTHAPAHRELARIHRARLVEAEQRNDAVAAAHHEVLLRQHDRGEHASFLRATGRVVLDSEPSGALVIAHRFRTRDRQLVLEEVGSLGTTPIDAELPIGSYLLELRAPHGATVRYPIVIGRDETWDTTRPGASAPAPVLLPGPLDAGETYVPAGFTWVGHDALAAQPVPSRRVWIDGFVIQTFPVTCREYLAFLDDLAARGDEPSAWRHAPAVSRAAAAAASPAVARDGDRFVMLPDEHGQPIDPHSPIASIDWHAATAYAEWLSARTDHRWRLPNELEWEKAARGVDRRPFPWGAQPEPTWACILGSAPSAPRRAPIDSYPVDVSPYGVRGLAGNMRDWCINVWKAAGPETQGEIVALDAARADDPAPRTIRGGAWTSVIAFARSAGRFAAKPDERFAVVGLRLVREL